MAGDILVIVTEGVLLASSGEEPGILPLLLSHRTAPQDKGSYGAKCQWCQGWKALHSQQGDITSNGVKFGSWDGGFKKNAYFYV